MLPFCFVFVTLSLQNNKKCVVQTSPATHKKVKQDLFGVTSESSTENSTKTEE